MDGGGGAGRAHGRRGRFQVDRLHRPGVDPERVLLLTDRALAGEPGSNGESLPDELAAHLADRSGRAVDLDVLTDLTPALKAMGSAFRAWRAWRYDAVVAVLDTRAADGRAAARRRIPRLLDDLSAAAALPTPVVVAGIVEPVMPGEAKHRTAATIVPPSATRALAEGSAVLVLPASRSESGVGRRRAVTGWADEIAGALAAVPRLQARIALPQDETSRQRALDATGAVQRVADPALQRIVALARDAFGAESAELNVIDHDRQLKVAVVGADPAPMPRSTSICDITMRRAAPTVIPDAHRDPRTAENPIVTGGVLGFYAAYPIESIEGYRIGALCVYDSRPREDATDLDLGLLRDFALLAEAELIDETRAARAAGSPA